jgi:hypothetical protein
MTGAVDGNGLAVHAQVDGARGEARGIGLDQRLGRDRQRGSGKARAQRHLQEIAAVDALGKLGIGDEAAAILYEVFHASSGRVKKAKACYLNSDRRRVPYWAASVKSTLVALAVAMSTTSMVLVA